jgi:prepilin signal peptidase PulO-like enzyme (type II secretory pathway)
MPVLDFFWTMMIFFLWVIWIWLLITVFIDLFRNKAMNGLKKAIWVIFLIFLPLLGVLVYLIVHGDDMHQRQIDHSVSVQRAQADYIQQVAGANQGTDNAGALTQLAQLHKDGALTDEEYAQQKAKVLNS